MNRLVNLGCKLNQYEGNCLLRHFQNVDNLLIVNTCVVTKEAERKSLKKIRQAISQNPNSRIAVTGCLVAKSKARLPRVDLIIDHKERKAVVEKVFPLSHQTRYFLKIQDGCDAQCSFCIVPLVRGANNSVPQKRIIKEIEYARDLGFPEVVLTGINLGAYGKDIGSSLTRLLEALTHIPSLPRLRLSSLEPDFLTQELFALFADLPFCHHLHLPIQSGDSGVLKMMNRHYDLNRIRTQLDFIKHAYPDFNFGADFIAGFPGEDIHAFRNSVDFIGSTPITYLHVFPYSPRPGTASNQLKDTVKDDEKKLRVQLLRKLGEDKFYDFRKMFVDQDFMATVEKKNGSFLCLTGNYIKVKIISAPAAKYVKIRIKDVRRTETIGEEI